MRIGVISFQHGAFCMSRTDASRVSNALAGALVLAVGNALGDIDPMQVWAGPRMEIKRRAATAKEHVDDA